MNAFSNPGYLLPPLVAALCAAALLGLVASRVLTSRTHRSFALFLLASGGGSLFIFLMRSSPDASRALAWEGWLLSLILASALAFYHFTRVYTGTEENRLFPIAATSYLAAVGVLGVSGLLVDHMAKEGYGYAPIFEPIFYVLAAWGYVWMVLAFRNVYRAFRAAQTPEERTRYSVILVAAALPLLGSTLDILPFTYPTGILGNLGFAMLTMMAMRRYRLLV